MNEEVDVQTINHQKSIIKTIVPVVASLIKEFKSASVSNIIDWSLWLPKTATVSFVVGIVGFTHILLLGHHVVLVRIGGVVVLIGRLLRRIVRITVKVIAVLVGRIG